MRYIFPLLIIVSLLGCEEPNNENLDFVLNKFYENSSKIQNVEYNIHRIDTFPHDDLIWNNKGMAYIERNEEDTIFGLSFYAKRFDINKEYIYKGSVGYEFIEDKKEFKNEKGAVGFLGKPGGQMVSIDVFKLDSIYSNIQLLKSEDNYIIKYEFEDDTVYDVTQRTKTVYLRKSDFFPIEIKKKASVSGRKSTTHLLFSDVKINNERVNKIDLIIDEKIKNYTDINQTLDKQLLIGKPFPKISLANIKSDEIIDINSQKPILIDFWETWCGPCIKSFPKVEELNKKYSNHIQVIGIVTQNKNDALELIQKKEITFLNLFGNSSILEDYKVNSFPRYFLIDKSGKISKEYYGFSDDIENDIKKMIEN